MGFSSFAFTQQASEKATSI